MATASLAKGLAGSTADFGGNTESPTGMLSARHEPSPSVLCPGPAVGFPAPLPTYFQRREAGGHFPRPALQGQSWGPWLILQDTPPREQEKH